MTLLKTIEEYRAQWLSDLRSGNYKQVKNTLRKHDEFCCLGVACQSFGVDFGYEHNIDEFGSDVYILRDEYGNVENKVEEELPSDMHVLFIEPDDEETHIGHVLNIIMKMNDENGLTFTEIADWIEAKEFGKLVTHDDLTKWTKSDNE